MPEPHSFKKSMGSLQNAFGSFFLSKQIFFYEANKYFCFFPPYVSYLSLFNRQGSRVLCLTLLPCLCDEGQDLGRRATEQIGSGETCENGIVSKERGLPLNLFLDHNHQGSLFCTRSLEHKGSLWLSCHYDCMCIRHCTNSRITQSRDLSVHLSFVIKEINLNRDLGKNRAGGASTQVAKSSYGKWLPVLC